MGFCVASTMNGSGIWCVTPSTVTWRSSIASSSADCVFGVARLISSASTTCAMIGPGRNSKSPVFWLKIDTPLTSLGSRSGVNWMRRKLHPAEMARLRARIVLPTPGTSSISTCPWHSSAISACRTSASFPMITFSTLAMIRSAMILGSSMGPPASGRGR